MGTHHSTIARLTTPLSGALAKISHTTVQHFEARARQARLARDLGTLSALDHYTLINIGMQSFHQLSPTQQEVALVEKVRQTF